MHKLYIAQRKTLAKTFQKSKTLRNISNVLKTASNRFSQLRNPLKMVDIEVKMATLNVTKMQSPKYISIGSMSRCFDQNNWTIVAIENCLDHEKSVFADLTNTFLLLILRRSVVWPVFQQMAHLSWLSLLCHSFRCCGYLCFPFCFFPLPFLPSFPLPSFPLPLLVGSICAHRTQRWLKGHYCEERARRTV